ncbi:MAG: ZIP family metal transporter [Heliobacteriaceae bacterium]|nr:ZIP family metal transporter [Heliobacteriaceae bacterium]MDD4587428.1 ZIP family metal transporter [Heliobacteriaceae bacterium]
MGCDLFLATLVISLLAGFATTVGAAVVLLLGTFGRRTLGALLGFAAGVMVAVVVFDLLPSAWRLGGFVATMVGFVTGVVMIAVSDRLLAYKLMARPWESRVGALRKMGYLIALGIALHDFPEGIAIAAGTVAEVDLGWLVGMAIGLHNIPEGIATAAPLRLSGMAPGKILGLTLLIALCTPVGTVLGFGLLAVSQRVLAHLLALAGGAMVYLVGLELWPEAQKNHRRSALGGILTGAVGMGLISVIYT